MKKTICLWALLLIVVSCTNDDNYNDEHGDKAVIPPKGRIIRIMTYNIYGARATSPADLDALAEVIRRQDPDFVTLNEVDVFTNRTGKDVHQARDLAAKLGMEWHFSKAIDRDGGEYGEGVTTRKKAVNKFSVALPKGVGAEPRVLVVMEMEDYVICTSHLDHVSSEAQLEQVELITKTMKERYGDSGKPVFLGGDMNATPSSETGKLLQKDWEILTITGFGTFPSDNPSKCIDYIMQLKGTPKCEVVGSQILRWFKSGDVTKASDHLPVMLDIKLPAKNK
mgnify:CR=1 FL=1